MAVHCLFNLHWFFTELLVLCQFLRAVHLYESGLSWHSFYWARGCGMPSKSLLSSNVTHEAFFQCTATAKTPHELCTQLEGYIDAILSNHEDSHKTHIPCQTTSYRHTPRNCRTDKVTMLIEVCKSTKESRLTLKFHLQSTECYTWHGS